jgi:hypothetical protein
MNTPIRLSRAVVVAAMFLFTASASAQDGTRGTYATDDVTRVGLLGALEFEDDTGFGLRGDIEAMPVARVGNGTLKLLGSVSWTNFGEDEGGIDVSTNVFRFIPGVRLVFPLENAVGIYGDAGLGVYHARASIEGLGLDESDTETSLLARFAAGGYYAFSPTMRLVAEVGVIPHFGDFDITPFTVSAGVSFAF